MRYIKILLVICFSTIVSSAWSQGIEITPSYGFQFGSKLNYGPNYIQIDDSDQYGLTLAYELDSGLMAEITYFHHSTQLNVRDVILGSQEVRISDLNADWVLIGATQYFKDEKVKPFAGAGLGLVFVAPKNENSSIVNRGFDNLTKFTFSFKTGANIMFSEVVGLNLQFNLLLPIQWGGFYASGGSGGFSSGVGVSSTTVIAGFSGGLVFKLGS
jgi:hypothetical protein